MVIVGSAHRDVGMQATQEHVAVGRNLDVEFALWAMVLLVWMSL